MLIVVFSFAGISALSAQTVYFEDATSAGEPESGTALYTLFVNIVPEQFRFPLIGFVNLAWGSHASPQIGFVNSNQKNLSGLQAGFVNASGGDFKGLQTGFVNVNGRDFKGLQTGFVNTNGRDFKGVQMGFINSCYAKAPLSPVLKADSNSIALLLIFTKVLTHDILIE
jgi:hypothetical protein